ncbi:hypothetical protein Egran_06957 [Elaphomyces granulatus]|uniref:Prokaryotic-type class I peptide chain release factors domain-containing protein n=1 Tax=Elaphomyces granulatus TaxID=519963 RepID=A0A232LMA0_9EURO|nr:hypothetical protein Egran_06957 [Elaphomyces granulatus]
MFPVLQSDMEAPNSFATAIAQPSRARSVAAEHATLSSQLAESFDANIARRASELAPVTNTLKDWVDTNESILELNTLLNDTETDSELRSLAIEDLERYHANLLAISKRLKMSLIPRHPFAHLPCLLEIRPGAGGDEAGHFALELLRMYTFFCSRRGLRMNILKQDMEDGTGNDRLTEAVIEVANDGSYDILKTETGVHRVQRVPATESKGRTHTSAVSVMVLPSFAERDEDDSALNCDDPTSDYYVDPQEVQSERMRASGPGGQHVNKTESAIRLTHIPTGIVVSMQDSRSQHANRRKAWQLLRARLAEARREVREDEMVKLRRNAMGGVAKMGRTDKIRTYNYGQSRCTDHRSGITVHNLASVLSGGDGLEAVMDSVRRWIAESELQAMLIEDVRKSSHKPAKTTKTAR